MITAVEIVRQLVGTKFLERYSLNVVRQGTTTAEKWQDRNQMSRVNRKNRNTTTNKKEQQ
jgi:hypothetical protein